MKTNYKRRIWKTVFCLFATLLLAAALSIGSVGAPKRVVQERPAFAAASAAEGEPPAGFTAEGYFSGKGMTHEHSSFSHTTVLTQTSGTLASGDYYLTADLFDVSLTVPDGAVVNLCLNGYAIFSSSTGLSPNRGTETIFSVNGTLNIYDCFDNTAVADNGVNQQGLHYFGVANLSRYAYQQQTIWQFSSVGKDESHPYPYYGGLLYGGASLLRNNSGTTTGSVYGKISIFGGSYAGASGVSDVSSVSFYQQGAFYHGAVVGNAVFSTGGVLNRGTTSGAALRFTGMSADPNFQIGSDWGSVVIANNSCGNASALGVTKVMGDYTPQTVKNVRIIGNVGTGRSMFFACMEQNRDDIQSATLQTVGCEFRQNRLGINPFQTSADVWKQAGGIVLFIPISSSSSSSSRFQVLMKECNFSDNISYRGSAGIYLPTSIMDVVVQDSVFEKNTSYYYKTGLTSSSGSLTVNPGMLMKDPSTSYTSFCLLGNTVIRNNLGAEMTDVASAATGTPVPMDVGVSGASYASVALDTGFTGTAGFYCFDYTGQNETLPLVTMRNNALPSAAGRIISNHSGRAVYYGTYVNAIGDTRNAFVLSENVPSSIAVSGTYKTAYEAFDAFDTTGMIVTAKNTTGQERALASSEYTVTYQNGANSLRAAHSSVTVSYTGTALSQTISVSVTKKALTRPSAGTEGKNRFAYDGQPKTYQPEGYDATYMTIAGNVQTNVSASSGYTASVSVKDAENCKWSTGAENDTVSVPWYIDPGTPTASVTCASSTPQGVAPALTLAASSTAGTVKWADGTDFGTLGEREFEWVFTPTDSNYKAITGKATVTVTVPQAISLTVVWKSGSQMQTYSSGQSVNVLKQAITVTAHYDNGTSVEISSEAYTLSGPNGSDKLSEGSPYIVTATYTANASLSVQLGVTVGPASAERIAVGSPPDKTVYEAFSVFDPSGMTIVVYMTDGSSREEKSGFSCETESLTKANTKVTIRYGTLTTEYGVTVTPKVVSVPRLSGTYAYSGTEQTASFDGYDTTVMTAESGKLTGTHAGTISVTFTLNDTDNYVFDLVGSDKTRFVASWTIAPKSIAAEWGAADRTYTGTAYTPSATAETGISGETAQLTVTVENNPSGAVDVGTYYAQASIGSVTGGQITDYALSAETARKEFKINAIERAVTWTIPENLTYDGTDLLKGIAATIPDGSGGTETLTVRVENGTTMIDAGAYTLTAVRGADDGTVKLTGNKKENVTVAKAKPTTNPSVSVNKIISGQGAPTLNAGKGDTPGTYAWETGSDFATPATGKAFGWVFTPENANYENAKGTFTITIDPISVTEIYAAYTGGDAKIYTSADLNTLKGFVKVTGKQNTGETVVISDGYTLAYASGTKLTAGDNALTVTYDGKKAALTIPGVIEVALTGISAADTGTGTLYTTSGETELRGRLMVTGLYNDGIDRMLTTYGLEWHAPLTAGDNTVTVRVEGYTYSVTVRGVQAVVLERIEGAYTGTATPYAAMTTDTIGANLTVTGYLNNGTTATLSGFGVAFPAGVTGLVAGTGNKVIVRYDDLVTEVTLPEVKGATLEKIEVTTGPEKTAYLAFETLDATGMTVTATYDLGGEQKGTQVVRDYAITYPRGETLLAGDATATIGYEYGGVAKTAQISVSVSRIALTKPSAENVRLEYNGADQTVALGEETGYDPSLMTLQNNTVRDAGRYEFTIALIDPSNYMWADGTVSAIAVEAIVEKAAFDLGELKFSDFTSKETGESIRLEASGVPAGLIATYEGTNGYADGASEPGVYQVTLTLTPDESHAQNYRTPDARTAVLTINRAILSGRTDGGVSVVLGGEQGFHPETELVIRDVTATLAGAKIGHREMKSAFEIVLMRAGEPVEPDGIIEVRISIDPGLRGEHPLCVLEYRDGMATDLRAEATEDGFAFSTSRLSPFVVAENTPLSAVELGLIIGGAALVLILLMTLLALVIRNKKSEKEEEV